jgi:hypothetical protein
MPQDNYNHSRTAPEAATFLREIEEQSPFEPGGRLPRSTRALLLDLDPRSLGRAVTILLRHAAALPPIDRASAVETIDALLRSGAGGQTAAELEVPALVILYRDLVADRSRQAISAYILRLIRNQNPETATDIDPEHGQTTASPPIEEWPAAVVADARPEPEFEPEAWPEPEMAPTPPRSGGLHLPHISLPRFPGFPQRPAPAPARPSASREPTRRMEFPPPTAEPTAGAEPDAGAGAGEATTPTAPRRTYRAYGLLESDETVLVGRPFELKVGLSPTSPPGVAGPPLELPKPGSAADAYELDIQLFADGFDLAQDESWRHSLRVSADNLYPSVVVHLTARDLPTPQAVRSITATFSIDGETLGAATRQIIVTTDPGAVEVQEPVTTATGTNITAPTGLPPADRARSSGASNRTCPVSACPTTGRRRATSATTRRSSRPRSSASCTSKARSGDGRSCSRESARQSATRCHWTSVPRSGPPTPP